MAVTNIDPGAPDFSPQWPERTDLDIAQVAFTYDAASDTLFIDFYGPGRPAASVPSEDDDRDDVYLRVDPATAAVVGLQIEHFLSAFVLDRPDYLDALELADLHGIPPDQVDAIRERLAPVRKRAAVDAVFDDLARMSA